jgi:hypothetical protein
VRTRGMLILAGALAAIGLGAGCGDEGGGRRASDQAGRCTLAESTCAADEYCDFPDGSCGRAPDLSLVEGECAFGGPGVVCAQIFQPVCGCDGEIYPSACVARAARVPIAHEGLCLCGEEPCLLGTRCCNPSLGLCAAPGEVCAP